MKRRNAVGVLAGLALTAAIVVAVVAGASPNTNTANAADTTLTADFTCQQTNLSATCVNKSTGDHITSYTWNFGDMTGSATGIKPSAHKYAKAGTYTVELTVKNKAGNTASKQEDLIVKMGNTGSVDQTLVNALEQAAANSQSCKTYVSPALVDSAHNVIPASAGMSYLASVPGGARINGDAISTPLAGGTNVKALFQSLIDKVCTEPYVSDSFGNVLNNLPLAEGVTVGDVLPELGPASAAQINPMVKAAYANPTKPNAWNSQEINASRVASVLNLFNEDGVQSLTSVKNLHFANGGLPDKDGYPIVEVNPNQELLPALVLPWEDKGQPACKDHAVIGVNVGDSRPEVFKIPTCAPPSTPGCTSHCSTSSNCTSNCAPPPGCTHDCTPSCKSNCSTTPTCKTNCAPSCTHDCGSSTPPGCMHGCTTSTPPGCGCYTKPSATQSKLPPPANSGSVSTKPSSNPTYPANPSSPAAPTSGGYNGGGSSEPGNSGSPSDGPTESAPNGGDPSGF